MPFSVVSMPLSMLGLLVQTVGAALLACVLLYLSRGKGNPVLNAAGYAWLFLFLSLASLMLSFDRVVPYGHVASHYFKLLFIVLFAVAAARMEHEVAIAKPFVIAALAAAPIAWAAELPSQTGSLFHGMYMSLLAIGWLAAAILILRSRTPGLGKKSAAFLALTITGVQAAYIVLFAISASRPERDLAFLEYRGFADVFLEMFLGISLIIWAMEDTEAKLSTIHARAVGDTQRSKRKAQIDPLTEAYNRFFLDEIRPALARSQARGSIVLIDVDGLKTINDQEGHEEGDKAIWTVATAIKKLIRGDDYLIRWGGDEFLVILPGMEEEVARKRFYMLPATIEEIRQSPKLPRAYRKFVAASVGVTPFSARVPFDNAMETADRVMYERKKAQKEMRGTGAPRFGATGPMRRITTDKRS